MRTNLTGFALTVGMGLIVLLLGFLGLSATGLVGFSVGDAQTEQEQPAGPGGPQAPTDSTVVLASAKDAKPLTPAETAAIAAGDALFKNNCAQCHPSPSCRRKTSRIFSPGLKRRKEEEQVP
jgi:uncharacterized iron-regulated membrane protein